ncbi:hypothetical protein [Deinococcus peraridilitoris]|uniref:Uncharacterized protein n=1 Tax=Deinococcus peraridilitoris (strain DSM 19664 / LMG 22246 / CIP 109416 / KR-200) TaxID=937777 RepID=K9ZWV6_DEIPD|nr:hypothetical protein [Deinococcus peraridilitoris]AFZ66113.1 hypothetical protein Deipe_0518 [Deinococcus peraridilitoris DSM 19664]
MNDQVLQTLRAAGFDVRPTATLDREGAFFALTEDMLFYLEGQKASSVSLRDITRIHSDGDGILRVKAGNSTIITAPLVGFEVARVQHFFAEVRHATARAKTLPPPPALTGTGAWKTGWNATAPDTSGSLQTSPAVPAAVAASPAPADELHASGAATPLRVREVVIPPTASSAEREPTLAKSPDLATSRRAETGQNPAAAPGADVKTRSTTAPIEAVRVIPSRPETTLPAVTAPTAAGVPGRDPVRISSAPVSAVPSTVATAASATPAAPQQENTAPVTTPVAAPVGAPRASSGHNSHTGVGHPLQRFVPTLRLLAILMGVTGAGVGLLEWRAGAPLSGLWTIGVGVVGAIALFVFGEVVRTVAYLADLLSREAER